MTASPAKSSSNTASRDRANMGAPFSLRESQFDRNVWCVLGLPIDIATVDEAVTKVDRAVSGRDRLSFVTPNVNWVTRAWTSPQARSEILAADLSLADGAPVAAIAKLLGAPLKTRVAGSDLFEALRRRPSFAGRQISVFFFGGRDGAAKAASDALNGENSGLTSAGWMNPGFGDVDAMSTQQIIAEINAAQPDFIVVALGATKGQAWIDHNASELNAPVIAHLGAVIDFTAGSIARAPRLLQTLGLEWAWRIKEDPALWRRYFNDGMSLAWLVGWRLIPQLVTLKRMKGAGHSQLFVETTPEGVHMRFDGDFTSSTLGPVREALKEAAQQNREIILDFSNTAKVDMAFLGLMLILDRDAKMRGRKIYRAGASKEISALFKANKLFPESAEVPESVGNSTTPLAAAG